MTELDQATLRVVVERLEDLRGDVAGLRTQLTSSSVTFVPRDVWLQRNEHVTAEIKAQGREIGDLRAEVRSKRLPWPMVLSSVAAAAALLLSLGVIGP